MVHYLSPKSSVSFHLMVPSVKMLISSCSLGVVAFVGEIASAVTTMVFNFVLLGLDGNTAVAAYGVIANTALVGTAIFNGVSQGLQPVSYTHLSLAAWQMESSLKRCSSRGNFDKERH